MCVAENCWPYLWIASRFVGNNVIRCTSSSGTIAERPSINCCKRVSTATSVSTFFVERSSVSIVLTAA